MARPTTRRHVQEKRGARTLVPIQAGSTLNISSASPAPRIAALLRFLALFLSKGFVVVGRIELGAISTPRRLFDGAVHVAQAIGRHAQRHHLADAHHHVPGYDLDAAGGKSGEV